MTKKFDCSFCNGTGEMNRGEKQKYRIRLKKGSLRIKLEPEIVKQVKKTNKDGDVIATMKEVTKKAVAPYFDHAMIVDPPGSNFRKPRLYKLTDEEFLKVRSEFEAMGIEYEGYIELELPSAKMDLPEKKKLETPSKDDDKKPKGK